MMSRQDPVQNRLFGAPRDLGCMVPTDHLLRKISEVIDFDFVYDEVEHLYSDVGRPSVPPPVLMKLMVILFLYDVRSERELMETIPYRIDWLWFLGYDLGAEIPDHSVLSKARSRWGVDLFLTLFELVVTKCVGAGLVDGKKLLCDSSLVDANASINSLFRKDQVEAIAKEQINKLDDADHNAEPSGETVEQPKKKSTSRRVSRTDPDAVGAKRGLEKTRPRYQTHRGIDNEHGVITATTVGPSDENEANRFFELLEQHESLTGEKVTTGVADKKYGTVSNLLGCLDSGITAYIRPAGDVRRSDRKGMFHSCEFVYSIEKDEYTCPAGQILTRAQYRKDRDAFRYVAPAEACQSCAVRAHCTKAKVRPRDITRHVRQNELDEMKQIVRSPEGREALIRRHYLLEGSFGQATRFGIKRARWRGLQHVQIQDYLIATIQNLLILIRKGLKSPNLPRNTASQELLSPLKYAWNHRRQLSRRFANFIHKHRYAAKSQNNTAPALVAA